MANAKSAPKYEQMAPLTHYIEPKKQAAKRHYGSHQYFTKRAWNVVQEYIKNFTKPGDVVCDPFGGSGVTAIEALALGRRAVYLDISPWATFLAEQVAVAPVNLGALESAFLEVEKACADKINKLWKLSDEEVAKLRVRRWYPKKCRLPKNADVDYVEELFSHRQLLALSEVWHHINKIQEKLMQDLLKYVFSATLYMCNKTFLSAKGRKASRGGSSIFSIYRYKIAKTPVELNVWEVFERRFGKLMACKKETNQEIGCFPQGSSEAVFITGQAQKLTEHIKPYSVDYIFTDPPYGAHIAYLDLTRMWDAWFGFEISQEEREAEAIEGGDVGHSAADYKNIIASAMQEMFKALKYDRWMSLVFAHREPAFWDAIVKAAESAGFEYVNTVCQPLNVIWSMHKKKNPLTVLSGELILNFRKVRNPKTLAIVTVGSGAVNLIKDSAELTIVEHDGATTEEIYSDLVPKLIENGLLGQVVSEIKDIIPLLEEGFLFEDELKLWYPKPNKKLGCHIPLDLRVRFYVIDFLNRCARIGKLATVDDIVFHVLPKLKNGEQPTKRRIVDEILEVAVPYKGKYYILGKEGQHTFDFAKEPDKKDLPLASFTSIPTAELCHNDLVYAISQLGISAGFSCHVGKKEQSEDYEGKPLTELSVKELSFLRGEKKYVRKHVEQIDVLWLDAGMPVMAFEIEHSTPFTTAIERFHEILKVCPKLSGNLVLAAPKSRKRKLEDVLHNSPYVGAPMYIDRKLSYIWYSQLKQVCTRFCDEQPTKSSLLEAVLASLHPASLD